MGSLSYLRICRVCATAQAIFGRTEMNDGNDCAILWRLRSSSTVEGGFRQIRFVDGKRMFLCRSFDCQAPAALRCRQGRSTRKSFSRDMPLTNAGSQSPGARQRVSFCCRSMALLLRWPRGPDEACKSLSSLPCWKSAVARCSSSRHLHHCRIDGEQLLIGDEREGF